MYDVRGIKDGGMRYLYCLLMQLNLKSGGMDLDVGIWV